MKYLIGDVHGCLKTLKALLKQLPDNIDPKDIILLGDLIDRGPNSSEVINFVREKGYRCLYGNHEDLMVDAWEDSINYDLNIKSNNGWTNNGGLETIENYEIYGELDTETLQEDIDWVKKLPKYIICDEVDNKGRKLFLTHATSSDYLESYMDLLNKDMDFDIENRLRNLEEIFIWNRRITNKGSDVYFNVSGHNVIPNYIMNIHGFLIHPKYITKDKIVIDPDKGYACIDTGAVYSGPHIGKLTCLVFPSMEVYQQVNIDE